MDIFELWGRILEEIKKRNPEFYNLFYTNMFPLSFSDGIFKTLVTNPYQISWFTGVYKEKLERIIYEQTGTPATLVMEVKEAPPTKVLEPNAIESISSKTVPYKKEEEFSDMPSEAFSFAKEETASFTEKEKSVIPSFTDIKPADPDQVSLPSILDYSQSVSAAKSSSSPKAAEKQNQISDEYTFENFVSGNCNQIAFEAAKAVARSCEAQDPSTDTYNPLFIYGPSGLGKTHLLKAICHYINSRCPHIKTLMVTSEEFINELIEAISHGKTREFRERYRTVDYLLLDDIQFFGGTKYSSRTEIFNTFNTLFNNKKHIIMTSDRTPSDLKDIEDRLQTRFASGLVAPISPPDFEICSIILQKKAERANLDIPEEVISFIAGNVTSSVRQLEGAYNQLLAFCKIKNLPYTLDNARSALADIIKEDLYSHLSADIIIDTVCKYYNVKKEQVLGKSRPKNIVIPRQMAMYIAREELNDSFPTLEKHFKKDHSTIVHAYERVQKELKTDEQTRKDLETILSILKGKK